MSFISNQWRSPPRCGPTSFWTLQVSFGSSIRPTGAIIDNQQRTNDSVPDVESCLQVVAQRDGSWTGSEGLFRPGFWLFKPGLWLYRPGFWSSTVPAHTRAEAGCIDLWLEFRVYIIRTVNDSVRQLWAFESRTVIMNESFSFMVRPRWAAVLVKSTKLTSYNQA